MNSTAVYVMTLIMSIITSVFITSQIIIWRKQIPNIFPMAAAVVVNIIAFWMFAFVAWML